MNNFLKAMVLGLGLVSISANAAIVVTPRILVHTAPAKPVPDKWFVSCDYKQSDLLPEGFGCEVNGNLVSVQDYAKSEKLNVSKLRYYKHQKRIVGNGEYRVIIEEIR